MPAITTNDLKTGITLELDNGLFQVVEFQHVKPGRVVRSSVPSCATCAPATCSTARSTPASGSSRRSSSARTCSSCTATATTTCS